MESWKRISFQNISCYCLTIPCIALFTLISIFQNISCYCLTGRKGDKNGRNIISKHLMLLFNFVKNGTVNWFDEFQNISCYCLTKLLVDFLLLVFLFQNISCYCLTLWFQGNPGSSALFQNISCYCLTMQSAQQKIAANLFQNISCYCLTKKYTLAGCQEKNFKTSHVIV